MDVHKIFFKILKNNMDPIFIFLNFYLWKDLQKNYV